MWPMTHPCQYKIYYICLDLVDFDSMPDGLPPGTTPKLSSSVVSSWPVEHRTFVLLQEHWDESKRSPSRSIEEMVRHRFSGESCDNVRYLTGSKRDKMSRDMTRRWYWGSDLEPWMMYFPILNEELAKEPPESSDFHMGRWNEQCPVDQNGDGSMFYRGMFHHPTPVFFVGYMIM